MTTPTETSQALNQEQTKQNDKELNFRMLEAKYEKQLAQERAARMEAEREREALAQERQRHSSQHSDDDDSDSEPYVDHKKLKREQAKFGQQMKQETQSEIKQAVQQALHEERKTNWIKSNGDFFDVMKNADKLYAADPELAETILEMPDTFERQKLVYKNLKALGLHKEKVAEPSIQQKIDANRRSPYYQPSGVGTAPYASVGNFSATGQKQAYDKMQELKSKMRLG